MISCETSSLPIPFDCAYFKHVMSKIVQYVTNNDKISKNLALINVNLHKHPSNIVAHGQKIKICFMLTIQVIAM